MMPTLDRGGSTISTCRSPSDLCRFELMPCVIQKYEWAIIFSYMAFSIVYYYAGGLDPYGNAFIYDILDWSKPGPTVGYVILCLVAVIILHGIVFGFYRY